MTEDLNKINRELQKKVRVLEEENALLTERAEDSLLLGLISENFQNLARKIEVFENTLERISILKAIPFATCGEIFDNSLQPIATYCAFSDQEHVGYPISFDKAMVSDLKNGPIVIKNSSGIDFDFVNHSFYPRTIAMIPFGTQTVANGSFVFMDNTADGDRFTPMLMLLSQIVEMAAVKYDNLFLLGALTETNKDLETRVKQRTLDLADANRKLMREVAERKASEKALSESHQTFLTVLNGIDATIYVADLSTFEILFMNKFMIDEFGRDFRGEKCFKVFRNEDSPCDVCTNKKLLDIEGMPSDVVVWQGKNPVTGKWYINYDRAITWIDGRLVRLQIATDITQIKKIESELQQAQKFKAIGTLAGGIAHDFNNLLMGIQGRASLMAFDIDSSHPHLEHIAAIEEYIRSATDLTKQLLGFARGGKYEVRPTDINELVMNAANMFGRTKKEILIHKHFQDPPPVVEIDRGQIEQVFLNIYVNAWQAMGTGGDLYLETGIVNLDEIYCGFHQVEPGRYAKVSITDTGCGMDESTRKRIFDPFFTTKEKSRGTGLGLASAYGIVRNHEGFITVQSKVGQGTTFNVFLPLSDKVVEEEVQAKPGLSAGTETIVVVDDEQMILDVGKAMLEKLGYHVIAVNGGARAIEIIKNEVDNIHLVILDLIMPGLDGGKTFDLIREIKTDLPVILSSGYSLNGQAKEIMQRGCNGFIQKPFNIAELSQKVRKVLDDI